MGYKQELLKKIEALREYEKLCQINKDEAFKIDNLIKVREDYEHVKAFFDKFSSQKDGFFGSKESYDQFIGNHQDIVKENRFPRIKSKDSGEITIPDVDYEKLLDAFEKDTGISQEVLEESYKNTNPNIRGIAHPLEEQIAVIKAEADTLFDENTAKELKNSLDYANEEIIEKTGLNVLDDVFTINSNLAGMKAAAGFKDYVKSQGLDENVVVNNSSGQDSVYIGLIDEKEYETYKPFLQKDLKLDEDYKQKLLTLDQMLKDEGLLEQAVGGESGSKEYGLADYFSKNYVLKQAIVNHSKLQSEEEKKNSILRINQYAKDVKDVSAKYDKIFNYIEKNFDLDNTIFNGNIYSGRPVPVDQGGIEQWRPNLPPKYDFENTKKAVFLSGFTQLKAACQTGNVTLEEYLNNPSKAYLKGAENLSKIGDSRYYLPRSEENTLGKRLARTLVCEDVCYPHVGGYGMIGGRALEFLSSTDPNKDEKVGNVIIGTVNKDFGGLYDHSPSKYFGSAYNPEIDNIKNIFAFADKEDNLYKVSNHYHEGNGEKSDIYKQYSQTLKERKNVPIEQEYSRVMKSMKDFATERKYMFTHQAEFTVPDKDGGEGGLVSHSLGTVLYAGRDYFLDYMKENNLSLASIQDANLRKEITSFITNPADTLAKHVKEQDVYPDSLEDVKGSYRSNIPEQANEFFQKFNECNNKPNGRNVGKTFTKIVSDNKGSWWERLRGKTSKEYTALQKIAKEACKPESQCYGDDKALYIAAIAYKNYKMPEGTDFNRLSATAKKRIEFSDSIINAYRARHPEIQAENQQAPEVENNNIIAQDDFHNQLANDINPQHNMDKEVNKDNIIEKSNEKDPPDEGVQP